MGTVIKDKKQILKEYKKGIPYRELCKKYNIKKEHFLQLVK